MERKKYDNIAGGFPPEKYTQVMHWIVYDLTKGLSPIDIAVYVILVQHRGLKHYCYVGNKTIAKIIGQKERSVIQSVKRLSKAGYIARVGTHKTRTAYTYILKYIGKDGLPKQDALPITLNEKSSFNQSAKNESGNLIEEVLETEGHGYGERPEKDAMEVVE